MVTGIKAVSPFDNSRVSFLLMKNGVYEGYVSGMSGNYRGEGVFEQGLVTLVNEYALKYTTTKTFSLSVMERMYARQVKRVLLFLVRLHVTYLNTKMAGLSGVVSAKIVMKELEPHINELYNMKHLRERGTGWTLLDAETHTDFMANMIFLEVLLSGVWQLDLHAISEGVKSKDLLTKVIEESVNRTLGMRSSVDSSK